MAVPVDILSKVIVGWIAFMCLIMYFCVKDNLQAKFFRFGPHEDLVLFGIAINSYTKYSLVVIYTLVGTIIRTLQAEVIRPLIIQEIQNIKPKSEYVVNNSYFVVSSDAVLKWLDFFMYINILLGQLDFMLLEFFWNLCTTLFTTTQYLRQAAEAPPQINARYAQSDLEADSCQYPGRKEI